MEKKLISFWLSVQETYPIVFNEAVKMLLPFISSYQFEMGFSAMVAIKTKLPSKLILSNSLSLKLKNIEVDQRSDEKQETITSFTLITYLPIIYIYIYILFFF